jgi:hypothetical protein
MTTLNLRALRKLKNEPSLLVVSYESTRTAAWNVRVVRLEGSMQVTNAPNHVTLDIAPNF